MTNLSCSESPIEWAAFVAIDWADQKHCWALIPSISEKVEHGELDATPEAVEAWAAGLNLRFSGRPIAVCLEQKRGALVYMLAKYAHLVIFPVHPRTAAQYRKHSALPAPRAIPRTPRGYWICCSATGISCANCGRIRRRRVCCST